MPRRLANVLLNGVRWMTLHKYPARQRKAFRAVYSNPAGHNCCDKWKMQTASNLQLALVSTSGNISFRPEPIGHTSIHHCGLVRG